MLYPGIEREVRVCVEDETSPEIDIEVPDGWACERLGSNRFLLFCPGPVADRNEVKVLLNGKSVAFTMLGPGEAKGFPAGDNVAKCPRCHARIEACICGT